MYDFFCIALFCKRNEVTALYTFTHNLTVQLAITTDFVVAVELPQSAFFYYLFIFYTPPQNERSHTLSDSRRRSTNGSQRVR